jgi:hypothetical protein
MVMIPYIPSIATPEGVISIKIEIIPPLRVMIRTKG